MLHGLPTRWFSRNLLVVVVIFFTLFSFLCFDENPRGTLMDRVSLAVGSTWNYSNIDEPSLHIGDKPPPFKPLTLEEWDSSLFVTGKPSPRYRDNLKDNTSYITTWCLAGYTNEFIGYVNLIYLSILAERVPVVPPFAPEHHIPQEAGVIPFGEIFNLTHLRSTLRMPILEWSDIKSLPASTYPEAFSQSPLEPLGCWSMRPEGTDTPHRSHNLMHHLGLDPSYTRIPEQTRVAPYDQNHLVFAKVAAAVYPRDPMVKSKELPLLADSWQGFKLSPDERLTCFDTLYYMTSGAEFYEWRYPWSPAWRAVGRHARFNQYLLDRAEGYLRRAFRLEKDTSELPKFIAVHMRHGDFQNDCSLAGHCLASLGPFAEAVGQIEQRLRDERNVAVSHVLVSSDETDPGFWKEVSSRGWYYIDHDAERTLEKYGAWHAPLVDVLVQSLASGFVGTEGSTFSLVSGRRVEDWNNGFYTMVSGTH